MELDIIFKMIVFLSAVLLTLIVWNYIIPTDVNAIGNIVCSNEGYGNFVSYDSTNNTINCKSLKPIYKYDGGYIKVIN